MSTATVSPSAPPEAASLSDDALHSGPASLPEAWAFFVRRASPRIILGAAVVSLSVRLALGAWSWSDLAIVAVIFSAWPFVEWLIHTFILHAQPAGPTRLLFRSQVAVKHRAHHRQPFHLPLLFFPTPALLFAVPALVALFGLALPPVRAATGLAFCLLMLLRYEWVHFLTHTRYRPRGAWYRARWRNHRLHHCKNEHYWMGVSTHLGDRLLGTSPAPDSVSTSPTCRTLGVAVDEG